MPSFKLGTVADLFPEKAKAMIDQDKEVNYGQMFQLSLDDKKSVVKYVSDCVEECKKQRMELIERKKQAIRNYEGIKDGSGPWEDSSNISTMITTIASDMMHSKLFPMVWNPDLMHFIGREKNDASIAENNKVLMQWAVTKDMEDSQDKADEAVWRLVVEGGLQVKVQWEKYYPHITRVVPESVDDRGEIKYTIKYDQVKRERAKWCLKDLDRVYFPVNAPNVREAEYIIEEAYFTYPMILEMKAQGLLLPDFDTNALKDQLTKLLDPDSIKDSRNTALGITDYADRMESYPIKVYEAYVKYDINDDDIREECVFITFPDLELYGAGKPLHCISKVGNRPWIIRPFLRRPGTMIGKGIPEVVFHLHNEMDAIHNQRIDAGNMVIAPFFFYRPASGFDPKKISVRPATGIPLDDPQRDVVFPNYNAGRLSVSFEEEKIVMQMIQMLANVTDPMMGKELANRPTARGTLAVIAQGDQRFTPLAARVVKIMSDLITITRRFYEENLDPAIANRVLGKDGKQVWVRLSPEMIAGDYDCYMDVDLATQNQALESQVGQILYQTMVKDEYVNQNPAYAWELRAMYIISLGKKDVEKIIGPKPDYQMSPGDIEDENLSMYQEQEAEVKPSDDHLAHVNSHAEFKRRMADHLTPQANLMLTTHLLEHRYQYQQKLQELAMQNPAGGGNANEQGNAGNPGTLSAPRMGTFQGPRVGAGESGAGAQVPQGTAQ
ncbi:MAG: hypothetical protein WC750_06080 [Patescibacteria group bacterium]|jgi:hypothetical protein